MAISTAFVFETIPFMKIMEKMTNPCFQDTGFPDNDKSMLSGYRVSHSNEG